MSHRAAQHANRASHGDSDTCAHCWGEGGHLDKWELIYRVNNYLEVGLCFHHRGYDVFQVGLLTCGSFVGALVYLYISAYMHFSDCVLPQKHIPVWMHRECTQTCVCMNRRATLIHRQPPYLLRQWFWSVNRGSEELLPVFAVRMWLDLQYIMPSSPGVQPLYSQPHEPAHWCEILCHRLRRGERWRQKKKTQWFLHFSQRNMPPVLAHVL